MMSRTKSLWIKISEFGLDKKDSQSIHSRSIIYCNKFSFVIALLLIQNFFSDGYHGLFFYSILDAILLLFLLPVFLLNKLRFYTIASIYLVSYCNIGIFILDSITGKDSGNYIYYLDVILLNFFIFNYSQKSIILINFLITSLLMICLELTDHSLFLDKSLPNSDKEYLFSIAIISNGCFMYFCMYSIVSSHTRIENQLQYEEKTLKSIFNFSPLGIALLNSKMQIVSFNTNLTNTLSRITHLEISRNQNILNYFPENERLNFENYFNLARESRVIRIEKNFKSEFTSFWFDITFSPVLGNNKVFHNIVLTLVDITKRKQLEIDAQIAKDKAEMANTSKSHFMSTMSKEIRTPMNEIIGITHGLIAENPRNDQIEKLRVLASSSENLSSLINAILNYDNTEASNTNLKYSKIISQTNQANE